MELPEEIERAIEDLMRQSSGWYCAPEALEVAQAREALTAAILSRLREAEARREEAERWAAGWHSIVEATLTMMNLSPALGAVEAVGAIQAWIEDEARETIKLSDMVRKGADALVRAATAEGARDIALARVEGLESVLREVVLRNRAAWPAETRAERMEDAARSALSEAPSQGDQ
ncbi:hypothetical protein ACLBYG_22645 [Methylobacterium sp. D53M]